MASKIKKTWAVYCRKRVEAEDDENSVVHPYQFVGKTRAVSEAQAINNVRQRTIGNRSQYLPVYTSGHWAVWLDWEAKEETRFYNN